jgi:predicted transcriptional regulator
MGQSLTVELSDEVYAALRRQAQATGTSLARVAAASLERQFKGTGTLPTDAEKQAARERFERHFGEVNLGHPTGADNESIDADLAREYSSAHEQT